MVRRLFSALIFAAVLLPWQGASLFAVRQGDPVVMIQGFDWTSWKKSPWWGEVRSRSGDLSAAGINLIWLPPPSDSLSPEGYMPRRLNVLDSAYGTSAQLASAVSALHAAGLRVICDLVLNHRVGTTGYADFTDPAWGADAVCSDDEWGKGTGAPDTGRGVPYARDIDHTNPAVQSSIKTWMKRLKDTVGYDGWRYDFARGYGSSYMLAYNRASAPSFSVAEVWDDLDLNDPDAHRQALADWLDSVNGEIKVFDFTTKGLLQQAVSSGEYWRLKGNDGRPAGLIGWWPADAVTFVDNHDTGPSPGGTLRDNAWPFPSDKVMAGYAYILTHPGVPCVYWPHFFDWGLKDQISALIKIRRDAGLTSTSSVNILRAEQGLYAAVIDGKVAVKLGDVSWDPGPGWRPAAQGPSYAVWAK
jgi:alpha-amylase